MRLPWGVYKRANPDNRVRYNEKTKIAVVFNGDNYFLAAFKLKEGTRQCQKYINENFLW